MKSLACLLIVVSLVACSNGQGFASRKSAFIDHINNFLNKLASPDNAGESTSTAQPTSRRPSPAGANIPVAASAAAGSIQSPIATRPGENPAAAINRMQNSVLAINLMETIAPPAVRPCFVRPAFCPATSDACSKSRCARLYANGVRIGSRFYKRVKCRLNYCRETCGKAEWYADGRRLVGCSDSSSTVDQPIWSVQRVFPKPARLDSRVMPIERVATGRTPPSGLGYGGTPFDQIQAGSNDTRASNAIAGSNPQRRSVQAWIGDLGESITNQSKALGSAIKQKFDELNAKRKEDAVARAGNVSADGTLITPSIVNNITSFINKQLSEVGIGVEHDAESQHEERSADADEVKKSSGQSTTQSKKTDLWYLLFLVGFMATRNQ